MPNRCAWANGGPLEIEYHDTEWGVPSRDDRHLFEMLVLEGAQAGLSWSTILRKRENYRRAFAGFDPARVARFDARRRAALMRDPGIVRNRLKIDATVTNARQVAGHAMGIVNNIAARAGVGRVLDVFENLDGIAGDGPVRAPGRYGDAVDADAGSDQDRLIAYTGRDPRW